ncbi:DUF6493 family protein [Flavobacterium collinsii]|uniref:WGR domain-containing protein n=1 Tax=Flavobacterium collinsii TaxID=1114861 RepID=A0ABM8KFC0_9FLAO|nr:DUF6493 family protein [Flavobacterium collinsii]CAA9196100.1 hypothetical protein FLACOL7796_00973 [Flavobacterium collinsii]
MKKSLKHIDGTSDKFWEIEVTGSQFTVTYGKNGTAGTTQTKTFSTNEECLKTAEKLVAEKIKKGYSERDDVRVASEPKTDKAAIESILQEYDNIIKTKDIDLLLPFLKENSKDNIEILKEHINENKRYWTQGITYSEPEFPEKENSKIVNRWGTRGDFRQKEIIALSGLALFNKKEINSWDQFLILLEEIELKPQAFDILLWAKPTWLESFILDRFRRRRNRTVPNYLNLRKLEDHNFIQFNPELYALSLSRIWAYCDENKDIQKIDVITKLLNDKTAYKRDIPELFNYETNLYFEYFNYEENIESFIWRTIYKSLLEEKKMNRSFFIENAFQIQTKEWNNNLKLFFRKRLEEFNVTVEELIVHQENIFNLLHYTYPLITNYGIELVKKIYDHPKFKTKSFLEWLEPLMMRSDCKTTIKSVLPILEKIGKTNPKLNNSVASIIAGIFVIADLTLQERASKILLKIGSAKDKALKEKLSSYASLMQGNIKSNLKQLMNKDSFTVDDAGFEEYAFAPKKELLLIEEVILPKDWNALLFHFKNFIYSDEILDAEILMNAYIQQRDLFPADCSAYYQGGTYGFCIHREEMSKFLQEKMSNTGVKTPFWQYSKINTYFLIRPLLEKVEHKIEFNSKLPLLSFPSHKPYWVAPKVLLERIIAYQKTNEEIDLLDLAIAIARMPRENVAEAIPLLDQVEGELKSLLSFCLGVNEKIELNPKSLFPKGLPMDRKGNLETEIMVLWAVAARTFYPNATFSEFENTYLKDVPFVVSPFVPEIIFNEESKEWYYINGEITRSPSWYELRFDMPNYAEIPNYLLYSLDIYTRSRRWENNLNEAGNMFYWHSLTPQNTDALALILLESSYTTSGVKQELKGFLNLISRPEFQFSDISLLLYACCFFQESKEIKLLASDELINLVERQAIDVDTLAQKFAFLLAGNYGVFSRMTDCIITLKDVSPLHNSSLLKLLNSLFEHLDVKEKLPANFKKLVENYIDVLTKTNQKPAEKAITFFEQWKDNPSLKSLIKQISK